MQFPPEHLLQRYWRLGFMMIIVALAFVYARLIVFFIFGLILFIDIIRTAIHKKTIAWGLWIPVVLVLILLGTYYIIDYHRVVAFREANTPLSIANVIDGTYQGRGMGLRGPIIVQATVADGKLTNIKILQHQEAISSLEGVAAQFIKQNRLDADILPATVHGAIEATEGFREALTRAMWQGIPERVDFSPTTRVLHYFSQFRLDMTTWNALAILFCIVLVLDYTLQPVLVRGTGQALNCYNCQTCVGVCPVKNVDGEPYPMNMILAARLGDYEKVKYLSKYCVACSRCAGKCPVGDSGPSIAAAANTELIRQKRLKRLQT
ncbi:4Fe-4S dicluster domain-containing protein [candidate division KSB1 bacterium]|nr:4Fe-4S dicluster domain-containing protein [candidate division KSB1 bacterium]